MMKKIMITLLVLMQACSNNSNNNDYESEHKDIPDNQVFIPLSVRNNLGITFAKVERRNVSETLRVPGNFEYSPSARVEYRTMLPGRIDLKVKQFDYVEMGQLLFLIDSPEWRDIKKTLAQNESGSYPVRSLPRQLIAPCLLRHDEFRRQSRR